METFIYLFKVNMAIAIFYLVYRAFYRKDTFFSIRRYLLLSMLILSALYPFVDFSFWMAGSKTMTDIAMSYRNMLPEIIVYSSEPGGLAADASTASYSFLNYFLWFYTAVTCFLLLRVLFRAMQIVWLRFRCESVFIEGIRVNRLSVGTAPFSFFSWVFINPNMHDEKELHEVLAHEMVHVRQRHSVDVLVVEFICAFCWINPLVWMLKKEIQKNLEFLVDNCVINHGEVDMKSYQYHLLKLAYHPSKMTLANQFNISPLKERIMMINVKKSPKMKLIAYTLILPLVLLFLVVNNVSAVADRINHNERLKNVVGKVSGIVSDFSREETVRWGNFENRSETMLAGSVKNKKEITGVILNKETKKPIAGVNIVVSNMNTGTITDADGRFKLLVNDGDTLKLSYVGYSGITLTARNLPLDVGSIEMSRKKVDVDEIVVVASGLLNDLEVPLPGKVLYEQSQNGVIEQEDVVFVAVEKMPEFPGGDQALLKYISENVNYPALAAQNGIEGRVNCVFTVNADGSVGNVRVVRGVDPLLDDEAMRVIYSLPKFIPGEQRGKKVAVEYSIPVSFRLKKQDPTIYSSGKGISIVSLLRNKFSDKDSLNYSHELYESINQNENPLVFLDGNEILYENIKNIDVSVVDNISVLRNSVATEQYGDKGKNGVIKIETLNINNK